MGLFSTISRGLERRDTGQTLLSDPAGWLYEAFGIVPTDSGISVSPHSSLRYTAVYACVNVLAQTIAQVPWNVYRQSDDGKTKKIAKDRNEHYLLRKETCDLMSSYSFRMAFMANLLLYGNAYAEILRDGAARVTGIRVIPSFRVMAYETLDQKRIVYKFTELDGTIRALDMSDVLHVPYLGENGVAGMSPIALHRQGIGLGLAAEAAGAAFFGNGSRPSGYLSSSKALRKEDREDLEAKWFAKFGGSRNQGKVPVLSGDLKWNQLSIPPSDAQYIETRTFQAADIARLYRVPAVLIGLADKTSTYASADAFFLSYVKFTAAPLAVSIEQEFDRKLFPNTEQLYTKFDLNGLLRGDPKARGTFYKDLWAAGALTANEIRDWEELDPAPGGDRAFVQQGFMPLDMVDEVIAKQGAGKGPAPNADDNSPTADDPNGSGTRSVHVSWLEDVLARVSKWEKRDADRIAESMCPVFRSAGGPLLAPHAEKFCREMLKSGTALDAADLIDRFLCKTL